MVRGEEALGLIKADWQWLAIVLGEADSVIKSTEHGSIIPSITR